MGVEDLLSFILGLVSQTNSHRFYITTGEVDRRISERRMKLVYVRAFKSHALSVTVRLFGLLSRIPTKHCIPHNEKKYRCISPEPGGITLIVESSNMSIKKGKGRANITQKTIFLKNSIVRCDQYICIGMRVGMTQVKQPRDAVLGGTRLSLAPESWLSPGLFLETQQNPSEWPVGASRDNPAVDQFQPFLPSEKQQYPPSPTCSFAAKYAVSYIFFWKSWYWW